MNLLINPDFYIFRLINSLAGKFSWLDLIGIFFAEYLGYILVAIILLFLLKNRKSYWFLVIYGLISAIFARFGFTELIRWLWQRPRPFVENNVHLLFNDINSASFPSGHAAFFFALSTVVCLYNKKTGILFFIASFLISISRVFCGIHWPSDIIAGAAIGIFSGLLILKIFQKI